MRAIPWVFLALLLGCGTNSLGRGHGKVDGGADGGDAGADAGPMRVVCGTGLCEVGEVCELGACHRDCGGGLRCGEAGNEACCATGEICYLGACTTPGMACGSSGSGCYPNDCPDGQYCEGTLGACLPLPESGACEYRPPVGAFSPVVKWEWQGSTVLPGWNQIMMTPMVADLDGDCMPDVVFSTFSGANYTTNGVLRAVRGDGSGELWSVTDPELRVHPGAQLALADVDGDGRVEVFACHESGSVVSFNFDGSMRWLSTEKPCGNGDAPAVANVDRADGPEIVVGFAVFDAQTGALLAKPASEVAHGAYSVPAELDGDLSNGMEIVGGGLVYHADGSLYWDKASANGYGYPAVADLDGDGLPDVVAVVGGTHSVWAYKHDGTVLWGPKDVNNGVATPQGPSGGGPPTIADFDGDGKPDVAMAGGYGYLVLRGSDGSVLWQSTATTDTSSRITGSSVFDFEGDGSAEAVYNDEHNLRVYRGSDGAVLVKLCSTSGTLQENPVIVDVDADDHADIVVMNNNYAIDKCDDGSGSHTGFKVISDAQNRWVRTRRIWNQHAYHVTNVNDDGTVPRSEVDNWAQPGLNDFRQNVQTHNLFNAPDLVPEALHAVIDRCDEGVLTLAATVRNRGTSPAPAGVSVSFYRVTDDGDVLLGTAQIDAAILAGAAVDVSFDWTLPGDDPGPFQILVVVDDDGTGAGTVNECHEDNNASSPTQLGCPQIG